MISKTENYMLSREEVYAMLTKEDHYAQGWGKGKEALNLVFPAHAVGRSTGFPFSEMEWINFAEGYLAEAKEAHRNFCPDNRAIILRMIKAASLLVTALQVHATREDINTAGTSCNNYPVRKGGLQTFLQTGMQSISDPPPFCPPPLDMHLAQAQRIALASIEQAMATRPQQRPLSSLGASIVAELKARDESAESAESAENAIPPVPAGLVRCPKCNWNHAPEDLCVPQNFVPNKEIPPEPKA